jgi:hypothetical protein
MAAIGVQSVATFLSLRPLRLCGEPFFVCPSVLSYPALSSAHVGERFGRLKWLTASGQALMVEWLFWAKYDTREFRES